MRVYFSLSLSLSLSLFFERLGLLFLQTTKATQVKSTQSIPSHIARRSSHSPFLCCILSLSLSLSLALSHSLSLLPSSFAYTEVLFHSACSFMLRTNHAFRKIWLPLFHVNISLQHSYTRIHHYFASLFPILSSFARAQ